MGTIGYAAFCADAGRPVVPITKVNRVVAAGLHVVHTHSAPEQGKAAKAPTAKAPAATKMAVKVS